MNIQLNEVISTNYLERSKPFFVSSIVASVTIAIISCFEQTSIKHHDRATNPDISL